MISKQQRRLLVLFIVAFGLLTVPVIFVLIKLTPPDELKAVSMDEVQRKITTVTTEDSLAPSELDYITGNKNIVAKQASSDQVIRKSGDVNNTSLQRDFIGGNWVVVDCGKRIVLQCPHRLLNTGTTPRFGKTNKLFQSHCRDVSIKLDSFCTL